ncbi:MAG: hypothetical protein IT374_28025 [Polyangiaceae bacterium]|nr:hypothetical protein [Polyangiaceae bacterium]
MSVARLVLSSLCLVASSSCLVACGATAQRPATAPAPAPKASAPAACAPGTPREPPGVREKMSKVGDDVKRCFLLGGRAEDAVTLRTELVVSEDGHVKQATLTGAPPSKREATICAKRAIEAATFAPFCGDDVALGWTFSLR